MNPAAIDRLVVGNIRRARRRAGLDQARFALALALPKWRLVDIEAGYEPIRADVVIRAAEILDLEIRDLFATPEERRAA